MSKILVKTNHSRYEIDTDEQTWRRTRVHEGAGFLTWGSNDGELDVYESWTGAAEGEHMVFLRGDGYRVTSTPVVSVEELADPVAA